jgi:hypothetical protein
VPLADAFGAPIFVMGVRAWELFSDADHTERLTLGRVVLRRETWTARRVDPDKTRSTRRVGAGPPHAAPCS